MRFLNLLVTKGETIRTHGENNNREKDHENRSTYDRVFFKNSCKNHRTKLVKATRLGVGKLSRINPCEIKKTPNVQVEEELIR